MVTAVIVVSVAVLLGLGAVLWVVHRLRPDVFRVNAGSRWLWFSVEMRGPRAARRRHGRGS